MAKLPTISGKQAIKIAEKLGFKTVRTRGSHVIMRNSQRKRTVIPLYKKLKPGTLLQIIKALEIDKEKLVELL